MTAVPDSEFFTDAERVRGKVVLITGAASGFGRSSALLFARYGARIVVADRDSQGAEKVVKEIQELGSQAIAHAIDVSSWEQQLELFQRSIKEYGTIDVVVANAGITERGKFAPADVDANNVPVKPSLTTLNVNLIGVLYTIHLAQHYLLLNQKPGALKCLVLMGSMSSFEGIPFGTLYTASKHAILGVHKTLDGIYNNKLRVVTICPWFSDTGIMNGPLRTFLAGIPLAPVERVAGTVVKAATDSDPETNGSVYTIPDGGETFRLRRSDLSIGTGVYKLLSDRAATFLHGYAKVYYYFSTVTNLLKVGGFKLFVIALIPLIFLALKSRTVESLWDRLSLADK